MKKPFRYPSYPSVPNSDGDFVAICVDPASPSPDMIKSRLNFFNKYRTFSTALGKDSLGCGDCFSFSLNWNSNIKLKSLLQIEADLTCYWNSLPRLRKSNLKNAEIEDSIKKVGIVVNKFQHSKTLDTTDSLVAMRLNEDRCMSQCVGSDFIAIENTSDDRMPNVQHPFLSTIGLESVPSEKSNNNFSFIRIASVTPDHVIRDVFAKLHWNLLNESMLEAGWNVIKSRFTYTKNCQSFQNIKYSNIVARDNLHLKRVRDNNIKQNKKKKNLVSITDSKHMQFKNRNSLLADAGKTPGKRGRKKGTILKPKHHYKFETGWKKSILTRDSILLRIPRNIYFSEQAFLSLSPEEQSALLPYLPEFDRQCPGAAIASVQYREAQTVFLECLRLGQLDPDKQEVYHARSSSKANRRRNPLNYAPPEIVNKIQEMNEMMMSIRQQRRSEMVSQVSKELDIAIPNY